ncbi:MAG: hypothetical protein ACTTGJ_01675 [Clostridium sp.]
MIILKDIIEEVDKKVDKQTLMMFKEDIEKIDDIVYEKICKRKKEYDDILNIRVIVLDIFEIQEKHFIILDKIQDKLNIDINVILTEIDGIFKMPISYKNFKLSLKEYIKVGEDIKNQILKDEKEINDKLKLRYILKYMIENISFNYTLDRLYMSKYLTNEYTEKYVREFELSLFGSIIIKKAVCSGISIIFYVLSKYLNLDSAIITGYNKDENGEGMHAWNLILVDNIWYNLDIIEMYYYFKNYDDIINCKLENSVEIKEYPIIFTDDIAIYSGYHYGEYNDKEINYCNYANTNHFKNNFKNILLNYINNVQKDRGIDDINTISNIDKSILNILDVDKKISKKLENKIRPICNIQINNKTNNKISDKTNIKITVLDYEKPKIYIKDILNKQKQLQKIFNEILNISDLNIKKIDEIKEAERKYKEIDILLCIKN